METKQSIKKNKNQKKQSNINSLDINQKKLNLIDAVFKNNPAEVKSLLASIQHLNQGLDIDGFKYFKENNDSVAVLESTGKTSFQQFLLVHADFSTFGIFCKQAIKSNLFTKAGLGFALAYGMESKIPYAQNAKISNTKIKFCLKNQIFNKKNLSKFDIGKLIIKNSQSFGHNKKALRLIKFLQKYDINISPDLSCYIIVSAIEKGNNQLIDYLIKNEVFVMPKTSFQNSKDKHNLYKIIFYRLTESLPEFLNDSSVNSFQFRIKADKPIVKSVVNHMLKNFNQQVSPKVKKELYQAIPDIDSELIPDAVSYAL